MAKGMILKVVMVGDSGVGKTSLMNQFATESFSRQYKATVAADFVNKKLIVDSKEVHMMIWDTPGQERFHILDFAFYRGANCCILVFDVGSRKSFDNLEVWRDEFLEKASPQDLDTFQFVVIGNKSDRTNGREVSLKQAQAWCSLNNCSYHETDATNTASTDSAFQEVARVALKLIEAEIAKEEADRAAAEAERAKDAEEKAAAKCKSAAAAVVVVSIASLVTFRFLKE